MTAIIFNIQRTTKIMKTNKRQFSKEEIKLANKC